MPSKESEEIANQVCHLLRHWKFVKFFIHYFLQSIKPKGKDETIGASCSKHYRLTVYDPMEVYINIIIYGILLKIRWSDITKY
jgi:hypothetical protein